MATRQVLEVTELLELILLKLPSRDALLAQCVCRYWKEVIKTSPALQEKLWLKSDTSNLLKYYPGGLAYNKGGNYAGGNDNMFSKYNGSEG
jgi:hypothetical protein